MNARRLFSFLRLCLTRAHRGGAVRDDEQLHIQRLGGTAVARGRLKSKRGRRGSHLKGRRTAGGCGSGTRRRQLWVAQKRRRAALRRGLRPRRGAACAQSRATLLLRQAASFGTAPIDGAVCGSS
jgi:hypothetical protein